MEPVVCKFGNIGPVVYEQDIITETMQDLLYGSQVMVLSKNIAG